MTHDTYVFKLPNTYAILFKGKLYRKETEVKEYKTKQGAEKALQKLIG